MNRAFISLCTSLVILACILTAACGANSSRPVTVVITSPTSVPTIAEGQTVNVTASASDGDNNGSFNTNVTWSLSGSGCAGAACGSLASETGNSVTYTAPASLLSNLTVLVRATSAADPAESNSISITVAAISVRIPNKITTLSTGTGAFFHTQFVATVQNDPAAGGVTWALIAGGAPCSPGCGTLSPPVGDTVEYVPPPIVPAAPANAPMIVATSVTNPAESDADTFTVFDGATACVPGGSETLLNGEYAIMVQGWTGTTPLLLGASFGADGTGKIRGGHIQFNPFFNQNSNVDLVSSASSYSVGPDHRGCLTLTDDSDTSYTLHFSLGGVSGGIASRGDVILFSRQSAAPLRGSGILRLQDPTAFSLSALAPNYAIGASGWASNSGSPLAHFALAGSFAQSGGSISSPSFDANDGGMMYSMSEQGVTLGNIASISTDTGEATATLSIPGPFSVPANVIIYVINSSELFVISNDLLSHTGTGVVFSGRAIATAGSFGSSSILLNYIFRFTGNSSGAATASIGLAGFSGGVSGAVSGTFSQYEGSMPTQQILGGTYGLSGFAGRLVITGPSAGTSPICYLATPADDVAAFCVSTDASAALGVFTAQPAATYGNNSLSGDFLLGGAEPADSTVSAFSGVATISSGGLTGTEDTSAPSGPSLGSPFSATLAINADGTGALGGDTAAVTNGATLYFINEIPGTPAAVQILSQQ